MDDGNSDHKWLATARELAVAILEGEKARRAAQPTQATDDDRVERIRYSADEVPGPLYLFYSANVHARTRGFFTDEFRNPSTGETVTANFVGPEIDGFPGARIGGEIVRPRHHETYVRVGEYGPHAFAYHKMSPTREKHYEEGMAGLNAALNRDSLRRLEASARSLSHRPAGAHPRGYFNWFDLPGMKNCDPS